MSAQTILVVEDFDDIRELLRIFLKARGYRVVETPDGEKAVRLARQIHPDLILMDIGLETLDGLSATCRIRQIPALRATPIGKDVPAIFNFERKK